MPKCGLLFGSLALSLAEVSSVRQGAHAASAVHVVEAIGELLQERNMGTEELVHQLNEYASEAVTPGAEGSFAQSLKVVLQDIEGKIEKKITDSQAATQSKLDALFSSLEASNTAASTAKVSAVKTDKSWFECARDEKANRQVAEHSEQVLAECKITKKKVCTDHKDSTGFTYDGAGKFKMKFDCQHSAAESCEAALMAWDEATLQKMYADAKAHVGSERESHDTLKASCEAKTQAQLEAKSTLDAAESAWSTKRAACTKLASQREASMCALGTKAHAKCSGEAEYAKLVAATKKAKGDNASEVDRESEWLASGAAKCVITNAIQKGLSGAVVGADLDACAAQVNFGQDVGKLNTRQANFDSLSKTNACANGAITFFNGETWNVPAGDKPPSKSYTKTKFTPQLDPTTSGNFDFCSGAAPGLPKLPQPNVESRPKTKNCGIYMDDAGKTLGSETHSVVMGVHFSGSKENTKTRQWILNIGQQGTGAEHWLWVPATGSIQFGVWNNAQIRGVNISKAENTLATVYDAARKTYSLYVDGELAKTIDDVTLNIKTSTLSAGDKQGYHSNANFNGCIFGVDIYYTALTAEQVHAASAKFGGMSPMSA